MYSCHSILECYNLFSGVKLNIRWLCFVSIETEHFHAVIRVITSGNIEI